MATRKSTKAAEVEAVTKTKTTKATKTAKTTKAAPKQKVYDESSIKAFKGLEGVRQRPSMYLGERGQQMAFRCLKEAVDNSYDEFLAGRNKEILVYVDTKSNEYIIADMAEGIPVGINKEEKKSTLELIMTELHAGGKLDDENSSYEASAGTHGVGISCVNAVSEKFEVWTFRDKKCHTQAYKAGKPQSKVAPGKVPADIIKKIGYKPTRGTIIRFNPDQKVISEDKGKTIAKVDLKMVQEWLSNVSKLNKGLKLTLRNADGKERVFLNTVGVIAAVHKRMEELEVEPMGKPVVYEEGNVRLALQWSSYSEDDGLKTFVSSSNTRDHGEHEVGLRNALVKAIGKHASKTEKYQPKDLYFGLIGMFDWRMKGAEFSSQVKDRLVSKISKQVEEHLTPILEQAFAKNKTLARQIIRRACEVKKTKEVINKMMKGIAEVKKKSKTFLPGVLAVSNEATSENRELYLVEGDSAGGIAKNARDSSFQEVLPLSGKPPSGMTTELHKLVANKAVQNFLIAMGYDFAPKEVKKGEQQTDPCANLRVRNIFLLADADVDGGHINVLILTIINRFMPHLFEEGRVFVVDAPLYSAFWKGTRYFGASFSEVFKKAPKDMPKTNVIRSKGWGEIDADTLAQVAFEPKTRTLIRIDPIKGKEMEYFKRITGSDTAAKGELIGL